MDTAPDGPFAFAVMRFAASFTPVYEKLIVPAVQRCGIACVRADREHQGHIHSQMLQRIYQATVVIADITDSNANVFYELGVAHSCGCKTVVICDRASTAGIPFDVKPYRVFTYAHPDGLDHETLETTIAALTGEIARVIASPGDAIQNPVQDYLASQSPVRSTTSLFVGELDPQSEAELLMRTSTEVVYYGITGNSFAEVLIALIEGNRVGLPLEAGLCLLDPRANDCWSYLYRMREAMPVTPDQVTEFMDDDVRVQQRTIRRLTHVSQRFPGFRLTVHLVSIPPLFWAYMIDDKRIVVGHLATKRLTAKTMPVSILVSGDPSTRNLFAYYHGILRAAVNPESPPVQ